MYGRKDLISRWERFPKRLRSDTVKAKGDEMTKYHGRMSPKAVIRAINEFVDQINTTSDLDLKREIYEAAYRFAISEARRNDKFSHVIFMERIQERTGVYVWVN